MLPRARQSLGIHSLWVRLSVLMLLTSLSLVLLLVVFYHQMENRLYKEFARQVTDITRGVQFGLEGSTGEDDSRPATGETLLQNLDLRGIEEVSVIGNDERIVASSRKENIGRRISQYRKELIFRADLGEPVTGEGQLFNVIVPLAASGRPAGYIHLTLNSENFSVLLRFSAYRRIVAVVCIFALGTFVAVVLARYYTRPIVAIAEAVEKVADGELDPALPLERRDEIGRLAQSFGVMIDRLKEDRQLRERLRTAEHLASVGQFARHIAHEIKNPLNFIALSIDHMRDTFRPAERISAERFEALIANLKGEIGRIGRFAESFLEYGRPFELQRRACSISDLVSGVLAMTEAKAISEGVQIDYRVDKLPELEADPELLQACLYNVVKNAIEAMPNGGILKVRQRVEGGQVVLAFEDNGIGVAPESLERLFTPLFSTKSEGLGLGLAFTRRVIEEHGGSVQMRSEPGCGSCVTFCIPLRGGL